MYRLILEQIRIFCSTMNFKEIFKHSVTIFSKWGGESVKRRKEEESSQGPEDVDHTSGYVRTFLDPVRKRTPYFELDCVRVCNILCVKVHCDGHMGHSGQGQRSESADGHSGELQIQKWMSIMPSNENLQVEKKSIYTFLTTSNECLHFALTCSNNNKQFVTFLSFCLWEITS